MLRRLAMCSNILVYKVISAFRYQTAHNFCCVCEKSKGLERFRKLLGFVNLVFSVLFGLAYTADDDSCIYVVETSSFTVALFSSLSYCRLIFPVFRDLPNDYRYLRLVNDCLHRPFLKLEFRSTILKQSTDSSLVIAGLLMTALI